MLIATAFIQARTSSIRLPGKVLLNFGTGTMLSAVVNRVRAAQLVDKVVVLTSNDASDDLIESECISIGVEYYRGELNDVLARFYNAALKYKRSNVFLRVTADCPFVDPLIINSMLEEFIRQDLDYLANTVPPPGTFPDGLDVEIFSFKALENAFFNARLPSEREHVTFYFWKSDKFKTKRYDLSTNLSDMRLTVDYEQDYKILRPIFSQLFDSNPFFNIDDVVKLIREKNIILPCKSFRNSGWRESEKKDSVFLAADIMKPVTDD